MSSMTTEATAVVSWNDVSELLLQWLSRQEAGVAVESQEARNVGTATLHWSVELSKIAEYIWDVRAHDAKAREQCPLGYLGVQIFEAIALATRSTDDVELYFERISAMLGKFPVYAIAGSRWPIFRMLSLLSFNRISLRGWQNNTVLDRFVDRSYSSLAVDIEEIAPFGQGRSVDVDFWLSRAELTIHPALEDLVMKSAGGMRLITALVAAVLDSWRLDGTGPGGSWPRPLVRVTVAFGEQWLKVMLASWARWRALGLAASIYVVMDEAAVEMCNLFHFVCVSMPSPTILHKYTITTFAMHLGVDILYADLDAVPVGPHPLATLRAAVSEHEQQFGKQVDLAVSTHNYDCLNAGFWLARASDTTASFFVHLLGYLYEHWYENDQRAFNAFATGNVSVSYEQQLKARLPSPPEVAVLSPDIFAGGEGFVDVDEVQVFHAYRVYGVDKLRH
eukprot:6310956-Amphidinium_carterae.1